MEEGCDLAAAAARAEGWSGDDMMNLARDAAMASLRCQVPVPPTTPSYLL